MKKNITAHIALVFLMFGTRYQPLCAGEWGAFLGALFGHLLEEVAKDSDSVPPQCANIDEHEFKKSIKKKIDKLCKTDAQSYNERKDIDLLKTHVAISIKARINTTCYASKTAAKEDCDEIAKARIAQHISSRAKSYAQQEALKWQSNPPVNPAYVNKIDPNLFAQDIEKYIGREVEQEYTKNSKGSLEKYWGDALRKKVATITQQKYERPKPAAQAHQHLDYLDYAQIEQDMMSRIDMLCATSEQHGNKQAIITDIKKKAREQLMYDIQHKSYASYQDAQNDAVQKLNSFLPCILQDYASHSLQEYVKQRATEAMERNAANGLKFLISDQLN